MRWCAASSSAPRRRARPRPSRPSTILPSSCARRGRVGEDGLPAAADRGDDIHDRRDARRSRRAQYKSRRLHQFREPDGSRGTRRAGGLPPRRHSLRRDADRPVRCPTACSPPSAMPCTGRSTARAARRHVHSLVVDPAGDRTREAGDVSQSGRGRGASDRPAAQLAACRTQGKAPRNDAHRPWLSALRPCRYLARQAGPRVRRHRPGSYRGRNLGDGGGSLRVVRRLDSGAPWASAP